jgi:hypothetical protein
MSETFRIGVRALTFMTETSLGLVGDVLKILRFLRA